MANLPAPVRSASFDKWHLISFLFVLFASAALAAPDDSTGVAGAAEDTCGLITSVSTADFQRLPIRTLEDWLALQNGIAVPYPGSREIHIRGAREYNNAFLLNGVRSENPFTGRLATTFSPYAIGQVWLQGSGGGVHHGGFTGGLVSAYSPMGGEKISGSVAAVSDNVGPAFDQNWYNITLSGPLAQVRDLRFFVAAERRYLGDYRPSSRAVEVMPGNAESLPGNGQQGWSYHGKLDWRLSESTNIAAWGDYSLDDIQTYSHEFYFFPDHNPRTEDKSLSFGTRVEAEISSKTSLQASACYFQSETVHGDGVVFDDLAAYSRGTIVNPGYDIFNLFRDSSAAGVIPYYDYFLKNKAQFVGIDGALMIDAGRGNSVTAGFDVRRYTLRRFENLRPSGGHNDTRVNRYGYDLVGGESDDDSDFDGPKHPLMGGVFVQDRIELEDITILAAARVDYFDLKGKVVKDPARPFGPDNSTLDAEDLVDSKTFLRFSPRLAMSAPLSGKATLFGSLAITHQLPPFLYTYTGWEFFEARVTAGSFYPFSNSSLEPEKETRAELGLSSRLNDKVSGTVAGFYSDRQDGLEEARDSAVPYSYDRYLARIEGSSYGAAASLHLRPAQSVLLSLNYSLSSTKSEFYTLQSQASIEWKNGSAPSELWPERFDQTHRFVGTFDFHTGPGEGPLLGGKPLLQDLSFVMIVHAASGFRHTRTNPYNAFDPSAAPEPIEPINSSRFPAQFQIDLKLQRTIRFGQFNLVPLLWIENLLDRENLVRVYSGTGEPDNTGYLDTPEGQERASDPVTGEDFVRAYELRQNDPGNFGTPRQIYLGMRVEF